MEDEDDDFVEQEEEDGENVEELLSLNEMIVHFLRSSSVRRTHHDAPSAEDLREAAAAQERKRSDFLHSDFAHSVQYCPSASATSHDDFEAKKKKKKEDNTNSNDNTTNDTNNENHDTGEGEGKNFFPIRPLVQQCQWRELDGRFNQFQRQHVMGSLLPRHGDQVAQFRHQMFTGKYSVSGELFASSCQDGRIRIHDTRRQWRIVRTIEAREVSWAVLDCDYSADGQWLSYCSWSDKVHLVNASGQHETHHSFPLRPPYAGRFCLFAVRFSPDSSELLGGSCDNATYVMDLVKETRTLRVDGHTNDVNAVCYLRDGGNGTGNVYVSGSDDCTIRVVDKRAGQCIGSFHGHVGGVTSLDSRDEHYILSNSKDQSVKLWDLRRMSDANERPIREPNMDYRMGRHVASVLAQQLHPRDQSLMTYKGHVTLQTLIRAYFSPKESTNGRYIFAGSFDGCVRIWDTVTGSVERVLQGHRGPVRDVSWNPQFPEIASVSWDGTMRVWNASKQQIASTFVDSDGDDDEENEIE